MVCVCVSVRKQYQWNKFQVLTNIWSTEGNNGWRWVSTMSDDEVSEPVSQADGQRVRSRAVWKLRRIAVRQRFRFVSTNELPTFFHPVSFPFSSFSPLFFVQCAARLKAERPESACRQFYFVMVNGSHPRSSPQILFGGMGSRAASALISAHIEFWGHFCDA